MGKIDIVKIDKNHKKNWKLILGLFLIISGIILLIPYIFDFIKILFAILLILIGIYLISKNKMIRNMIFFRF